MTLPLPHLLVNGGKLPAPGVVVEELAVVKAVVVGGVALCMVGGGEHRHLVAVDGVAAEEELHLVCNLETTARWRGGIIL